MKNLLSLLPALALLTLGGCAGTSALSTTENDGVYYSSQDRTSQNATASVARTAPAEVQSDDEISNPDYASEGQRTSTVTESTEYYDEDYAYSSRIRRFHQPYYRGFGYGYNDFVFADPYWYGGPSAFYGNGFYDPFYGPAYGYGGFGGSFVNINIGFGRPYGYGYNPWRYGRGYGGFGDYYGGGYGYGGLGYGGLGYGGYGGFNNYNIYNVNNYYGSGGIGTARNVRYGPRTSRSAEAGTASRAAGTSNSGVTGSRSRAASGGIAAPTGGRTTEGVVGAAQSPGRGRSRATEVGTPTEVAPNGQPQSGQTIRGRQSRELTDRQVIERETRYQAGSGKVAEEINSGGDAPQPAVFEGRSRRTREAVGTNPEAAPQYSQPRRSRASEMSTSQPSESQDQSSEQPVRRQRAETPQRTYEAPQRTYEAPQRTYEAPQRSYEAPQRSEPSRSSSPSNDGGGNSGGGRGRGRE